MEAGVVIAAASHRVAQPFARFGDISLVQRLTLTYRKAGLRRIVVVTGFEDPEIKAELTGEGVMFVQLADYENPELIESFRMGLAFLRDQCERVFLTPVNVPMYTFATVQAMLASPGEVVIPSCRGHAGHPVLVGRRAAQGVRDYDGPSGLAGFISSCTLERRWVDVADEGILYNIHHGDELRQLLPAHDESLVQPASNLAIRKAKVVFDARTLLLLRMIDETHAVSASCRAMSLSLTRAWRLINDLERTLGFAVVARAQGGHHGGRTQLTEAGRAFVEAYERYSARVDQAVSNGFRAFWGEVAPLMPPAAGSAEPGDADPA